MTQTIKQSSFGMGGTRKHYVAVGRGVEPMVVPFQIMGKGHALFAYFSICCNQQGHEA